MGGEFPFGPGMGDSGFFGAFIALFVLFVLIGVGVTIWKIAEARRMAREAGMDENRAAAMSLLTDDGFEATYLLSGLKSGAPLPTAEEPAGSGEVAARLKTLDDLRAQGLVTDEEYAARRTAIIESI